VAKLAELRRLAGPIRRMRVVSLTEASAFWVSDFLPKMLVWLKEEEAG